LFRTFSANVTDEWTARRANYFLLRNGEFGIALIREIERLKFSRLTPRGGGRSGVIKDQDLSLALLRASLGTSAQHDPTLSRLRFTLPSGPLRPLLPSLSSPNISHSQYLKPTQVVFDDFLLGTTLNLTYSLSWPLDLFLTPSDLQVYSSLFAYLSAIRRAHSLVLECWSALSGAQRARRRWTGLGEGGTEDGEGRRKLLRCGWGVVREMIWFLDTLLAHIMTDVVDLQFKRLKEQLKPPSQAGRRSSQGHLPAFRRSSAQLDDHIPRPASSASTSYPAFRRVSGQHDVLQVRRPSSSASTAHPTFRKTSSQYDAHEVQRPGSSASTTHPSAGLHQSSSAKGHLDFSTLRTLHNKYLNNLLLGSLFANQPCAATIRSILLVCGRFVAQVERWGGDILPPLLSEGSIAGREEDGGGGVGELVRERWKVVREINEV
jgi:gamma-tubulin complex component 4